MADRPLGTRDSTSARRARVRRGGAAPALAVFVALAASGCLPLLLGSARTLKPGEFTIAVAEMERTGRLSSTEYTRAGPSLAVVEVRGGLPGDRMDAGLTLHIPWNASWDLKLHAMREGRFIPALAVQVSLGLLSQPTVGGALLATKAAGPVEITGTGGYGHSTGRIWPAGEKYWSGEARNHSTDFYYWGAGIEYRAAPALSLLAGLIVTQATRESLVVEGRLLPYDLEAGPGYFLSAGIRTKWKWKPQEKPKGTLTALQGYVLNEVENGQLEVGRPDVYRATVLIDSRTRITADGEEVEPGELTRGRAVLIQGLSLPRPSTFLARTIELQN